MVDAMRSALQVSTNLAMFKNDYESLNYKDVFYMATLGGAICKYLYSMFNAFFLICF